MLSECTITLYSPTPTLFFLLVYFVLIISLRACLILNVPFACSRVLKLQCLQRYMADIGKAWPVLIVCGGILPLFLSVIWLLLIRHFVAAMPWITVGLFNILIIAVTMFYYLKGQELYLTVLYRPVW